MLPHHTEILSRTSPQSPESTLIHLNRTNYFWRRLPYPTWLEQAAKFFSVGVLNTVLDIGLYFALTRWVSFFAAYKVLTKCISYGVGILNSFYWNKTWTFKSEAAGAPLAFVLFALANLLALAVNAGVMQLCLDTFSLSESFALILATGTTFGWNFAISKFVVFRE